MRHTGRAALVIAGAVGLALFSLAGRSIEAREPFNPQCEAWDAAASAAVARLIADRNPLAEARLGDALFRLRRARKNCRHQWLNLARLDYDALTHGRHGQSR